MSKYAMWSKKNELVKSDRRKCNFTFKQLKSYYYKWNLYFLSNDNTVIGDKNLKFPAIKVNKKYVEDDNYKLLGKDNVSNQ